VHHGEKAAGPRPLTRREGAAGLSQPLSVPCRHLRVPTGPDARDAADLTEPTCCVPV